MCSLSVTWLPSRPFYGTGVFFVPRPLLFGVLLLLSRLLDTGFTAYVGFVHFHNVSNASIAFLICIAIRHAVFLFT